MTLLLKKKDTYEYEWWPQQIAGCLKEPGLLGYPLLFAEYHGLRT
jgi:hypothetical protein